MQYFICAKRRANTIDTHHRYTLANEVARQIL